jgi:hypothetical protein
VKLDPFVMISIRPAARILSRGLTKTPEREPFARALRFGVIETTE